MAPRPRLPLAPATPYLEALRVDRHQSAGRAAVLADVLGVSTRSAKRYHVADELPERHADTLAARLDLHPLHLWPAEWAALTNQGA